MVSLHSPGSASLPLVFGSLLLAGGVARGQAVEEPPADRPVAVEVDEAVRIAVELLLVNQEDYRPDPPVGSMPDDVLPAWQARERERLDALRGSAAGAAREWPYEGVYRVRGGVIPSGYRVGGTAIVCEALIAAPGYADDARRRAAVGRSVEFLLDTLAEDPQMAAGPKRGYDVRGWGHTYALDLFLRLVAGELVDEEQRAILRDTIPELIDRVATNETQAGGWNYASDEAHSPFQTGATLLALFEAHAQGFELPEGLVERALDALESGRDGDTGAFAYSGTGTEPMHASAARAAVAELCLFRAGRSDALALRRAVDGFFDGWNELLVRKSQQGTHRGPYSIAPYYFFFGHTYAALAIEALPGDQRPELRVRLQELLWRTREAHGGWNDRIFPRTESFSTAMSVLALVAPSLPRVPDWDGD